MAQPVFHLKHRFPSLATLGIAVEFFPGFRSDGGQLHGHDLVEMVYVASGEGLHRVGEVEYRLHAGALGIVHFGQVHGFRTEGDLSLALYNLYLDPRIMPLPPLPGAIRKVVPRILPLAPGLGHEANRIMHLDFLAGRELTPILKMMLREQIGQEAGWADAMRGLFRLFLIECGRAMLRLDRIREAMEPRYSLIEEVRAYLDTHAEQEITLHDLAGRFSASKSYLCREFKSRFGTTMIAYRQQRRIERAMVELASTDEKIASIAFACGFGDVSRFGRVFKGIAGCPPSAYRARARPGVRADFCAGA